MSSFAFFEEQIYKIWLVHTFVFKCVFRQETRRRLKVGGDSGKVAL